MKKIIIISFLISLLTATYTYAQENSFKRFSVTVAPTHLFLGNAKLEVEYRIGKKMGHSIAVAPQFHYHYFDASLASRSPIPSISFFGYGLEVQHKLFLLKIIDSTEIYSWRPYFSYGIGYNTFENKYRADVWYPYEEDGLTYITYGEQDINDKIYRWRGSIFIGVQKRTGNFLFEAFGGMTAQFSNINEEYKGLIDYKNGFWKYGYTGFAPRAGFKIGWYLF